MANARQCPLGEARGVRANLAASAQAEMHAIPRREMLATANSAENSWQYRKLA